MTTTVNENKLLSIVLAVLLPPLAVYMKDGLSTNFWLNVVLTIAGFWIIGVIHALMLVL